MIILFQIVVFVEVKIFYKSRGQRLKTSFRTNHMLILNLALADFLMGVYLIMLGTAGAVFDGNFCSQELAWRSSISCQVMGVLSIISSETSVFTLVLLAAIRLFVVVRVSNIISPIICKIFFESLSTHLFVKVTRPGDSEVTFAVFESSCHLLLPV